MLGAINDHYDSGAPLLLDDAKPREVGDELGADHPLVSQIKELLAIRVRPAIVDKGGDVGFLGIEDGVVILEMRGSPGAVLPMRVGIDNMVRHYVPEIEGVRFIGGLPPEADNVVAGKPGLNTPEARIIQELLDEEVNPAIASHGGYIALIDIADDRAYVKLGGGCQGCGQADVTLKFGIENSIRAVLPGVGDILDVTDHASGRNPYYTPSKK